MTKRVKQGIERELLKFGYQAEFIDGNYWTLTKINDRYLGGYSTNDLYHKIKFERNFAVKKKV